MSTLVASRGDLSLHNPNSSTTFPPGSGLNQSTQLVPAKVYAVQTNMEATKSKSFSHQDAGHHFDVFKAWKKGIPATGTPNTLGSINRDVLGSLNVNTASRSRSSASATIPRPSATPDVFAPEKITTTQRSADVFLNSAKRSRDLTQTAFTSGSAKRVKLEREAESASRTARAEEEKWRAKWVKVFPTLVFHFEIGSEEGAGKYLKQRVTRMGAKIDQFFSTRVTHLIVKGGVSPQKAKTLAPSRRDANRDSSKNPFLDGTGVTDLAQKAEALNIKVWTVKKLADILSRISPVENSNKDSLSTLLEDEKINGTRERDLTAPRPDYYYFKPGSKYLLIEDATGKHRTIMVKEYAYSQKDGPEWPTLYDGFLRVSSSRQSDVPVGKIRERAWNLYVERKPFEGEQPPQDLKRSTSLRAFPTTPKLPEAQPYHHASGNSVTLTSTIASTSTAGTPVFGAFNALPGLGANKDRAIMQLSKRVQVLKGNARLAAAKQEEPAQNMTSLLLNRRASMGQPQPVKTFMTQDQLVKMLQQAREPIHETGITVQMRMRNREKVDMGLKGREQDTAAGYCENCRLRYTDLSVHIASKKHRRFATNDENFEDLDRLLYALQRPLHPATVELRYPPCNDRHTKDAECYKCNTEMASQEGSEEETSSEAETRCFSDDNEQYLAVRNTYESFDGMGNFEADSVIEAF
ncbi:uncharacterized protein I206_104931 [Kwoniella pini CBS 10737]|uniref:DBF4-type domain-containing protein n=1 Tax=Kwoniella pini CBS 10737 TaxID=1296096 RepID=A0A1B9I8D1_9TREE|nr:uncharacterized protein I206_02472 [Kwoniella pini CBS 10737]OCF51756.1 hypothetical protein I206_02472 [Kwoniella pini CBS 10737]